MRRAITVVGAASWRHMVPKPYPHRSARRCPRSQQGCVCCCTCRLGDGLRASRACAGPSGAMLDTRACEVVHTQVAHTCMSKPHELPAKQRRQWAHATPRATPVKSTQMVWFCQAMHAIGRHTTPVQLPNSIVCQTRYTRGLRL